MASSFGAIMGSQRGRFRETFPRRLGLTMLTAVMRRELRLEWLGLRLMGWGRMRESLTVLLPRRSGVVCGLWSV